MQYELQGTNTKKIQFTLHSKYSLLDRDLSVNAVYRNTVITVCSYNHMEHLNILQSVKFCNILKKAVHTVTISKRPQMNGNKFFL